MTSKYHIRVAKVASYSPSNHELTRNQRLVGRENVGATQIEVVLGTIMRGGGAVPHSHPGIEQVCYLLEGTAHVEVDGDAFEMLPGDVCFFPSSSPHVFKVTSEVARVLVMYGPPYEENPERVDRSWATA